MVTMRAGDTVLHRPTGETWVLAWGDAADTWGCDGTIGSVSACGWPESIARMSDCDLVTACSDAEHEEMLRTWADKPHYRDSGSMDYRSVVCRRQLDALLGARAAT